MHTYQMKFEKWLYLHNQENEYILDGEFIITSDVVIGEATADALVKVLYGNKSDFIYDIIEINEL